MQSCSFRQKITKQHSVVLKQLARFRNTWQGKTLQLTRIQTYCNQIDYITELHSTYVYNCIQYSTQKMRQQILQVNKCIIEDLVKKIKYFSEQSKRSMKTTIEHEKKQLCQICASKLRQVDVKIINDQLSDDATLRRTLLKKIYSDLENQNVQLFSKDDDEMFFKFLKSVLAKKQEMVSMQTKEINDFLVEVTKSFNDLNFLTDFTPGTYGGEAGFRSNYKQELTRTINGSLKSKFHQRIYPWMQKVFDNVKKQILKQKNKLNQTISTQTEEQAESIQKKRNEYLLAGQNKRQIQALKEQIQQSTIEITELKSKLMVIEKQKKQLQEYYAEQLKGLMMEKKQMENKLKKAETDLFSLKQANQEILQVNKRLRNQRKRTELSTPSKNSTKDVNNKDQQKNNQQKANTNNNTNQIASQMQRKLKKKKSKINRLWSKINQPSSQRQLFIDDRELQQQEDEQQFIDIKDTQAQMSKTTEGEFMNNNKVQELMAISQGDEVFDMKQNRKTLKDNDRSKKQIGPWGSKQKQQKTESNKQQQQQPASKSKQKRISTMNPVRSKQKKNHSQMNKNQQLLHQSVNNNHSQGYSSTNLRKKSSLMRINNLSNMSLISQQQNSSLLGIKSSSSSIQMGVSSTNVLKKLSIQKQHQNNPQSQMRLPQDGLPIVKQQSFLVSRNSKSSNLQSKKRVFEFVPLQNQVQYKQLRQTMTEITAMMKSKTIQMLKSNVKSNLLVENGVANNTNSNTNNNNNNNNKTQNIQNCVHTQQQQQQHSEQQPYAEMGPIYGYSIFNQSKHQLRSTNRIPTNNSQHSDSLKKYLNEKELGESEKKEEGRSIQRIHGGKCKVGTLMDQVPVNDRFKVYQHLKNQYTIPDTLTFQHYQLMVKKLFAKLYRPFYRENQNIRHLHTRTSSSSNNIYNDPSNYFNKMKLKKTDYDNKFDKTQQQKTLLNLPKLQNPPNNKLPTTSSSNKSLLNINTMREKMNLKGMASSKNLTYIKVSPQKDHDNIKNSPQGQLKSAQTSHVIKPPITTPKYNETFGMKDLPIFFQSQLAAYEYEQTSKYTNKLKQQQRDSIFSLKQLNEKQRKIIQSLYSILTQIKLKNHEVYHKICSFLKFPYQTVTHGFEFINIGKDISFEKWRNLLISIYSSRYQRDDKLAFGEFIKPFEQKIVELIVTVSSSSNA